MKSVAGQDESVPVPAAPAAAAPRMAKVEFSDEPAAAMQQDTTEEAPQASEVESREEPLVAMQQDMTEEAPQADAAQSSEEPPVAKQQAMQQDAPVPSEESQADEVFDDPEGDRITLPLVELQIGAALVAVALGGATLVAVRRRKRSVL